MVAKAPKAATSETRTSCIKLTRKNGDVYLIQRQYVYDPILKRNKNISSHIISKIPKGSTEPVPTRSMKKRSSKELLKEKNEREQITMLDIIDHIGKLSCIDENLYSVTDKIRSKQIISIARFMLATGNHSLKNLTTWQKTHYLPYASDLTKEVYTELYNDLGNSDAIIRSFFNARFNKISGSVLRAYDYLVDMPDSAPAKVTAIYCVNARQNKILSSLPFGYYFKENFDTSKSAQEQITALYEGLREINPRVPEYISKVNGNLYEYLDTLVERKLNFTIEADFNNEILTKELPNFKYSLKYEDTTKSAKYPNLKVASTHILYHNIEKLHDGKLAKKRSFRRVYIHFFFDKQKKDVLDNELRSKIEAAGKKILNGATIASLDANEQSLAKKYVTIGFDEETGNPKIIYDEYAIFMAQELHGFTALLTNIHENTEECYEVYNARGSIHECLLEDFGNQEADSSASLTPTVTNAKGELFVRFIALSYLEYLKDIITKIVDALGTPNGDPSHDIPQTLEAEENLKDWFAGNEPSKILQWFDVDRNNPETFSNYHDRFSEENMQKDRLIFNRLGISHMSKVRTIH